MINKKEIFVIGIFLFLIGLICAAANAPTTLIFNNNATSSYDEGFFFVNWTSGAGDAEANYSIYVFSDDVFYLKADNNSVTGYSFSNTTEANYTFIIEAVNATADTTNSTTNISIYVDSTAPTVTLPHYTNATFKKNTDNLILNISISDASSGLTGSVCLIDVNGTNQSITVSGGWCNNTAINLTGLSDGNQTIKVYVNDTVNNLALNNSYVVQIDSTAPTVTLGTNPLANLNRSNSSTTFDLKCFNPLDSISAVNLYGNWSSGWHANYTNTSYTNNTWLNTTVEGISDGIYVWGVYCNDSAGNTDWADANRTLIIDTTAPTVSFSCFPTSVSASTIIICSCSGTDVTSGVATTSYTANPSTLITGTFLTTCTVTDYAGNSASSGVSYSVSSSGGGSSTTNEWSEQKIHSWSKITPGTVVIMKTFNKEYGIKQIQIEVNNEAQDVEITVKKYDSKPAEVSKEKTGKVNKYLQIETTNLEDKLNKAILTIQLEKFWVSENNLDKDKIAMFKFDETIGKWNELTTIYKEENIDYYYYDIELTSFSYFSIGEKDSSETISDDQEGEGGIEKENKTWLWIIGIIVLVIIGWIIFSKKKRNIKNLFKKLNKQDT